MIALLLIGIAYYYLQKPDAPPPHASQNIISVNTPTEAEIEYYKQSFDYALSAQKDGDGYTWKSYSASGTITPGKTFESKQHTLCRPFTETMNIQGSTITHKGIGCKRQGKDGWCRLKEGDFQSCALEPPNNKIEEFIRDSGESYDRKKSKWDSFIYKWSPF